MPQPSICVFCGSRSGQNPAYGAAAQRLGERMADRGWRLVYGAGDVGLMGTVANATQDKGGDTFGVIPDHLVKWEVGKTDLTRYVVTENMHERKKVMFMNSDAIVVLPGGAGSLDEFFEVLTWRQLKLHKKPIYLVSIEAYWAPLMALMHHVIDQGFADASLLDYVQVVDDIDSLEAALAANFSRRQEA